MVDVAIIRCARRACYLGFAQRAECIYLEPFVDAFLVETVCAGKFTKLFVVCVLGKADAANSIFGRKRPLLVSPCSYYTSLLAFGFIT